MLIDYTKELQHLDKVRKGEIKEGYKLGIPELDNYYRFKRSSVDLFLGQANVGKTSMVLYLMLLYSIRHDIKWVVFSSETAPSSLLRPLLASLFAAPLPPQSATSSPSGTPVIGKYFKFSITYPA